MKKLFTFALVLLSANVIGMEMNSESLTEREDIQLIEQYGISSADDPFLKKIIQDPNIPQYIGEPHNYPFEEKHYGCKNTDHRALCIFYRLCYCGWIREACDLIKRSYINPNMKMRGLTPIHMALLDNFDKAIAQCLLENNDEPSQLLDQTNSHGRIPLEQVIYDYPDNVRSSLLEMLIQYSSVSQLKRAKERFHEGIPEDAFFANHIEQLLQKQIDERTDINNHTELIYSHR